MPHLGSSQRHNRYWRTPEELGKQPGTPASIFRKAQNKFQDLAERSV